MIEIAMNSYGYNLMLLTQLAMLRIRYLSFNFK